MACSKPETPPPKHEPLQGLELLEGTDGETVTKGLDTLAERCKTYLRWVCLLTQRTRLELSDWRTEQSSARLRGRQTQLVLTHPGDCMPASLDDGICASEQPCYSWCPPDVPLQQTDNSPACRQGAKFAKWRAALKVGAGLPSEAAIERNAGQLAEYAVICQVRGALPPW